MAQSRFAVLRLSRLPQYFGEKEVLEYLRQFGKVDAVYMPKSKKTLMHQGCAFVKISKELAPIVVSTLDSVLNFNKLMKCEVLSDPKWSVFRRKFLPKSSREVERKRQMNSALSRSTRFGSDQPCTSGAVPSKKNKTLRRRTRSFAKRLESVRKSNPEFAFHAS
ncbi:hypothetical protein CRM22_000994 [Opisthorchis felineus]|uniref:RRM domain-containing protein n=1 Tax=Opisthorchis felineus TaxID=147828 RepID=A0A4V6RH82_OPIFE|nr:hypothetical protein CRM22_000994 [Opisthorchis felineus]